MELLGIEIYSQWRRESRGKSLQWIYLGDGKKSQQRFPAMSCPAVKGAAWKEEPVRSCS